MASEKEKESGIDDANAGCLSRCTNAVVLFLESGFYKFGHIVGGHPWITILIASLIAMGCAAGMIKFQEESRTENLWVPVGSPVLGHKQYVEEHYPSESRFAIYLVEAENILKPNVLQKMLELYEKVKDITVEDADGNVVDWESLCYRLGPRCFASSVLELWSFNSTIINALSESDIVDKVNEANLISPVFFSPVDIESMLGGITRDANNKIESAGAAIMTSFIREQKVYVKSEGKGVDFVGEAWELKFSNTPDDISDSPFTVFRFTASSFETESGESINNDLTLLAAGYMLIIAYVIIAMSKFTFIEHKVYLSFAGILTVGLSIISAMGLASAFGQLYGPVHSVLPFLLLGIGVDDMFVLVAAWYNLTPDEKKLDVREQVARSLKHSGVSITVTSVTDFCAFLIGATTILPALRSFCIYCGIGIIFLFFFSITFFLSWLVIDQLRLDSRRDACCCCYRHKDDYVPSEWGQRAYLQEFFYKYYSPFLLNIPMKSPQNQVSSSTSSSITSDENDIDNDEITLGAPKIIILVITFGLLGVCTWGAVTWEQNFDFRWFLPADGNSRMYFDANEKYFPGNGFITYIYFDDVDYYKEKPAMSVVYTELMDSSWMQATSVTSWYESYGQWLMATKAGDPGLDSNNWPRNETLFYDWLVEFVSSPQGARFMGDIKFNSESSGDRIVTSRITGRHVIFKNSIEEIGGMDTVRSIAINGDFQADGEKAAFGYSELYLNFESNKVIQNELLRNLGLACVCVFIVIFILLANLLQTIYVFCCVIFTLVDLSGALNFWGITIDTVVAIQLILAIGLAVDYSVHIGHTFMIFKGSRNDRTRATLGCMGAAVFNGGFSTFLAFILLAASNSYIFTTFFKIFFLVVLFGLFHGLAFLPVVLSLIGPRAYLSAKPAETIGVGWEKTPRSVTPEPSQDQQDIMKDPEMNGEARIAPVFNPAFVKEDEVEMKMTNGSANHQNGSANHQNGSANHQREPSHVGSYQGPPPYHLNHSHPNRQSTINSTYHIPRAHYPPQQMATQSIHQTAPRQSRQSRQPTAHQTRQPPQNRQPAPHQTRQHKSKQIRQAGPNQGRQSTRGSYNVSVREQTYNYGPPSRYSGRL